MSPVMALGTLTRSQSRAAAVTPPAGPDSSIVTGRSATAAGRASPPLDCMK